MFLFSGNCQFILRLLITVIFITGTQGCSGIKYKDRNGSIHHLIIGLGVVSIPKNEGDAGVFASKTQVVGIHASDQPGFKFGAGYSTSSLVIIPESTENIIVEVVHKPLGSVTVDVNPYINGDFNE